MGRLRREWAEVICHANLRSFRVLETFENVPPFVWMVEVYSESSSTMLNYNVVVTQWVHAAFWP